MAPEARLQQTEHGLVPKGEGWFVLNLRDAEWRHADGRGAVCVAVDDFESERRDVQLGVNPFVLRPGEAMGMYHWEADQEAFLVVSGEAVLIVEGEERPLRTWDFFHCPPQTRHVIVGAGSEPCVVVAVGARERDELGSPSTRSRGATARASRRTRPTAAPPTRPSPAASRPRTATAGCPSSTFRSWPKRQPPSRSASTRGSASSSEA